MGFADFAIIKNKDHRHFPGPGSYAPKSDFDKQKPAGRAASLRGRIETKPSLVGTNEVVGPGKYDIKTAIGEAPGGKFVFSGPHQGLTSSETNLGPKYDVHQFDMASHPNSPRYTFGSKPSPRKSDAGSPHSARGGSSSSRQAVVPEPPKSPSQTPRSRIPGPSFGGRPTIAGPYDINSLGPGPGGYTVPRFGDKVPKPKPPPGQHVEHEGLPKSLGPGPGEYAPMQRTIADAVKPTHALHLSRGTLPGRHFPPDPKNIAPGPGAYDDPRSLSARAKAGAQGVSILTRMPEFHDMDDIYPRPAPGDYAIPSTINAAAGVTFGARRPPPKPTTNVPAPGHVDVEQYGMAAQALKSGRGIKFNANASFTDGVKKTTPREAKAPEDDSSHGGGKNKSSPQRSPTRSAPAQLPALAKYDLVRTSAPAFTMSGRHKAEEIDASGPGPGSYDIGKYESKGPAINFHRAPFGRPYEKSIAPGPGAYDSHAAFVASKPTIAKSFGGVTVRDDDDDTTPRNRSTMRSTS